METFVRKTKQPKLISESEITARISKWCDDNARYLDASVSIGVVIIYCWRSIDQQYRPDVNQQCELILLTYFR